MENLNIRNFKLINGDNIIALISVNNRDHYLVERPVAVYITALGGYQFQPWCPFSDRTIYSIDKHNIISDSNVIDNIKAEYIKYALAWQERIPGPETQESLLKKLTKKIADRVEIETEPMEADMLPLDEDTVH